MDNKTVSFKESGVIWTTMGLILLGSLSSVIPDVSLIFLILHVVLALISGVIFYVLWMKHKKHSKRYYSLLSYVMILAMAIYMAVPLFRVYYGTIVFWFGLFLLLITIVLPYMRAEKIAIGILNPSKHKIGKVYMVLFTLLMIFGSVLYTQAASTQNPDAKALSILGFGFSMICLFIAPILLIPPERVDELDR